MKITEFINKRAEEENLDTPDGYIEKYTEMLKVLHPDLLNADKTYDGWLTEVNVILGETFVWFGR